MEINPLCIKCLKEHPKWILRGEKVFVREKNKRDELQVCNLIKTRMDTSKEFLKELEGDEASLVEILFNPVKWSAAELKWVPRWYQDYMLSCSAYRKVNRIGRRAGKTETLCVKMMHHTYTNENTISLVIAPYKNQVGLIFDRIDVLLSESEAVVSSIKRNTKNPYRLEFYNGSKILGFTSGTRTGSKSTGIRGQDAHAIFIDEADFLSPSDFEVILAILASRPDCYLWASSTPTGKREMYWRWCSEPELGFKEFHYSSSVSPNWTRQTESLQKSLYTEQGYAHEFDAEFGEETEGVFLNKYIDRAVQDYTLGRVKKNKDSIYTMGVDWNAADKGTHIVVVEWNKTLNSGKGAYKVVEKVIISQIEFTQVKACEEIIALNQKWDPTYIYVDQGFGNTQIEMLHKYGLENPKTRLANKVKGIFFGDTMEIRDPVTKQRVKKHMKPFMVNLAVRRLEDDLIILPEDEDVKHGLVGQMRDYTVIRRTALGQPIYSDDDDHTLVAWMLCILAATIEHSDISKAGYVPHIGLGGKFGEKKDGNIVVDARKEGDEKRRKLAITPRWPTGRRFKEKTLKSLTDHLTSRDRIKKKNEYKFREASKNSRGSFTRGRADF